MIRINAENDRLVLDCDLNDLAPRHASQLAFWGFSYDHDEMRFLGPDHNVGDLVTRVCKYLEKASCPYELVGHSANILARRMAAESSYVVARKKGQEFKEG
ncbi:MAG: hypothetical protein J4F39_14160, partial [Candidatus Latescibacteria bacterium]|nr:hypothetical protein [Candidatus Latescibacterota bacterium]